MRPNYYKKTVKNENGSLEIQPVDIIEAYGLNYNCGTAVAYILRAKYKEDYEKDLKKAITHLQIELDKLKDRGADTPEAVAPSASKAYTLVHQEIATDPNELLHIGRDVMQEDSEALEQMKDDEPRSSPSPTPRYFFLCEWDGIREYYYAEDAEHAQEAFMSIYKCKPIVSQVPDPQSGCRIGLWRSR